MKNTVLWQDDHTPLSPRITFVAKALAVIYAAIAFIGLVAFIEMSPLSATEGTKEFAQIKVLWTFFISSFAVLILACAGVFAYRRIAKRLRS